MRSRLNERQLREVGISKADLATLRRVVDFANGEGLTPVSSTVGVIAAAGGGQSDAVELTTHYNDIATVVTAFDSVKLPPAESGLHITIKNNGANACDVFPAQGDDLGPGINIAIALTPTSTVTYECYDNTTWG